MFDKQAYMINYRRKNKQAIKIQKAAYRKKNRDKVVLYERQYRERMKEYVNWRQNGYRKRFPSKRAKWEYARYARIRYDVLQHYSTSVIPVCNCCGEKTLAFLSIDHINGGGLEHFRQLGFSGSNFTYWLKRHNYPDGFQILCMNCNFAKGKMGKCPHQIERDKQIEQDNVNCFFQRIF